MSLLRRAFRSVARRHYGQNLFRSHPRFQSTDNRTTTNNTARASRILDRLPTRFQKYTTGLRRAPLSHIVAFLILHEVTAVVPLVAFFSLFHYTSYTPLDYVTGSWALYARDGAAKAERYFSRKGWFGFEQEDKGKLTRELDSGKSGETHEIQRRWSKEEGIFTGSVSYSGMEATPEAARETRDVLERWRTDDTRYKVVVEVALAWAVTKALLPIRIIVSVWATPWFAGIMTRAGGLFRK